MSEPKKVVKVVNGKEQSTIEVPRDNLPENHSKK
jgi:hypothetical protein